MAAKYPNNLIVQVNKPLDEKLVCEKLSDLTEYLYVGLLTYQKLDGKYYYVKSIDGGVPTWEELKTGATSEGGGEISEEVLREYAKKDEIPTKVSQLTNDSGYVAISNLLKNTNFGDGFNGWTKSGSVTIKNDVYEGIGAAYIDGGGMIGQDVTLDAGVYTLSFRVANGSISREWPLKVLLRRANVSNVVTNAEGWNNDDIPTIAVTSVSDKVYITFTLALASNINIDFENSRYGCLVDSIRLEKGDTVSPYDEYLMQKRLVSGLNIATINGQSLLDGGNIVISGGGGGGEIPNDSVTEYKLANGAVSTAKIKDGAVTMAKLSEEVKNKLNQGGKIPEVIDEEIYYNDGSNKVVPIKHPDLSTQPSILPYKFMGQYVYEQLIPIAEKDIEHKYDISASMYKISINSGSGLWDFGVKVSPDNMCILSLDVIADVSFTNNLHQFRPLPIDSVEYRNINEDFALTGLIITCKASTPQNMILGAYVRIVYTSMPEEGGDYYGYNNY